MALAARAGQISLYRLRDTQAQVHADALHG